MSDFYDTLPIPEDRKEALREIQRQERRFWELFEQRPIWQYRQEILDLRQQGLSLKATADQIKIRHPELRVNGRWLFSTGTIRQVEAKADAG